MGNALRKIYVRDDTGEYSLYHRERYGGVPMTYAGWKESQGHDLKDGYKTKIYTKHSKSGLSLVPRTVVITDKYGRKDVYTDFKRDVPNPRCKNCKLGNCNKRKCDYVRDDIVR